jgi:hypothetical protein
MQFFQRPVTSFLFGPIILLSTQFSNSGEVVRQNKCWCFLPKWSEVYTVGKTIATGIILRLCLELFHLIYLSLYLLWVPKDGCNDFSHVSAEQCFYAKYYIIYQLSFRFCVWFQRRYGEICWVKPSTNKCRHWTYLKYTTCPSLLFTKTKINAEESDVWVS